MQINNQLMTNPNTTHNDKQPHWYILGAGAIGCLWAACLRRAGFTVTLITRRAASRKTVTLKTATHVITQGIEVLSVEELLTHDIQPERLLVTTKAQQTSPALNALRKQLTRNTVLLVIQNGLAAKEVYAQFPNNRVIAGVTTDGAYLESEQIVVQAGTGKTLIGEYAGGDCSDLFTELPTAFLNIECCTDIEIKQWQKLAVNCAANALTAIYHCRNGDLLNNTAALNTMRGICDEVIAVTKALGFPQEHFAQCFELTQNTLQITANNYSSMYKDIERGSTTEIDYINGYLCKEAQRLNIPCPENQGIIQAIKKFSAVGG